MADQEDIERAERLKKWREKLEKRKKDAKSVRTTKNYTFDVMFLIDITGSMDPYMDQVVRTCSELMEKTKTRFEGCQVRFGFTGYRDHDMDPSVSQVPFTENVDELQQEISQVKCDGGFDFAEDVAGGFAAMLNMDWQSEFKIVIWVTDAPNHGDRWNGGCFDEYKKVHGDGDFEELLKQTREKQIQLFFQQIWPKGTGNSGEAHVTDPMVTEIRKVYDSTDVQLKVVKLLDPQDFADLAFKSIVDSTGIRVSRG